MQLLAKGLGKVAEGGPCPWAPATHVTSWNEAPSFSLAQPFWLRPSSGSDPVAKEKEKYQSFNFGERKGNTYMCD